MEAITTSNKHDPLVQEKDFRNKKVSRRMAVIREPEPTPEMKRLVEKQLKEHRKLLIERIRKHIVLKCVKIFYEKSDFWNQKKDTVGRRGAFINQLIISSHQTSESISLSAFPLHEVLSPQQKVRLILQAKERLKKTKK